jgi:hypothetical protein
VEPKAQTLNEDLSPRVRRSLSRRRGMGWLSVGLLMLVVTSLGVGVWFGTMNAMPRDAEARTTPVEARVAPVPVLFPAPIGALKREVEERWQTAAPPKVLAFIEDAKALPSASIVQAAPPAIEAPPVTQPVTVEPAPALSVAVAVAAPRPLAPPAQTPVAAQAARRDSPVEALPRAELDRLVTRAQSMIGTGDIAGARLLLTRAVNGGDARAAFAIAETYDPAVLARWRVRGIKSDPALARGFYQQALAGGIGEAQARIATLK